MSTVDRRRFLKTVGASAAVVAAPSIVKAKPMQRVVVIGGGFGGATAAKYTRLWSEGSVETTLVDPKSSHTSCIMSNLVLNGRLSLDDLRFRFDTLAGKYGVNVVKDSVVDIDPGGNRVSLASGDQLYYDRLIVSPGISFKAVPGLNAKRIPHGWIAGVQTSRLKNQIANMPIGGTFVMTIPPAPYRCPPGPYERACLVANIMVRERINGKVIVLDANPDIIVERELFHRAFRNLYGDIIEYYPDTQLLEVDSAKRVAMTDRGEFVADVLNVIPTHKAHNLLQRNGLTGDGDWADVHPLTYESTLSGFEGVHVIGDSQALTTPKSGHHANGQAKVCADAVLRLLSGRRVDQGDRARNIITNSACFSPITYNKASWLTAVYAYKAPADDPWAGSMQLVSESFGSAPRWSRENFQSMWDWWANLSRDTFL